MSVVICEVSGILHRCDNPPEVSPDNKFSLNERKTAKVPSCRYKIRSIRLVPLGPAYSLHMSHANVWKWKVSEYT